jgi:response regulator of citrate/malate metabolism
MSKKKKSTRSIPRDCEGRQLLFDPETGLSTAPPLTPLTAKQRAKLKQRDEAYRRKCRENAQARRRLAQEQIELIQLDRHSKPAADAIAWATGILAYLPAPLARVFHDTTESLTFEQVSWMDGMDDYRDEYEKIRSVIRHGIEVGFGMALAQFREPLSKHAPAARKLIVRLDDNRKLGTETMKAKPVKDREKLRALMATASAEGRELTYQEITKELKCSRVTAWRRKTEIELEPRR